MAGDGERQRAFGSSIGAAFAESITAVRAGERSPSAHVRRFVIVVFPPPPPPTPKKLREPP